MNDECKLRPWTRLPLPAPKGFNPGPKYFYDNFVQPISEDMIKLMCTGLYIDDDAVERLKNTIDDVLSDVAGRLLRNSIIQKYQKQREAVLQKVHFAKCTEAVRTIDHYLKPYEATVIHRTWVVNTYLKSISSKDIKESWTVKDLKSYNIFKEDDVLRKIIDKSLPVDSSIAKAGMKALAEYKMDLWNKPRYEKGKSKAILDPFNPASAKQKQELFAMLNIEPLEVSDKTSEGSWGREVLERLLKVTTDKDIVDILNCMIDHSFSGIIKNNFLKAFKTFTIDGVLHGNIKVLGAKTARPTSNSPSLLNMPSTKSIYAKPLKKCFIAPEGMLVYAIDFEALEDKVVANLSGDGNKIKLFTEGLDGHSMAAVFYKPEEAKEIVGEFTDKVEASKILRKLGKDGCAIADKFRQDSKAISFKLSYGGHPDNHKGGAITQEIFDAYHFEMYPGISDYKEEILKAARQDGKVHLGLGFYILSDDVDTDSRTLFNATCQFWSILTLIAINELNYRVEKAGLQKSIRVCSTIYDSIYIYVDQDTETIKWLNDNITEIMSKDFMENQKVKNSAVGDLGKNWTDMVTVPVTASIEDIEKVLTKIEEK